MADFYSVSDVSKLVGASVASIRSYAARYASFMSPTATPTAGQVRRFSDGDVKLIAYVYEQTANGATHDQVLDRLTNGALDAWNWTPPIPIEAADTSSEGVDDAKEGLVPISQLRAAQVLVEDARQREQKAADSLRQAQSRIELLQSELGQAQGALEVYRRRRPRWWSAIFGE